MTATLLDHCAAAQTAADGNALVQKLADGTTYGSFSFSQSPDFTSLLPVSLHCARNAQHTWGTERVVQNLHDL